jgi:glycosyltransferase involved in cell wall biosynthesis
MTVSVVLPCYKDAPHLRRNVGRIVQTLELLNVGFEVFLVNDASPDETGAIAEEIASEFAPGCIHVIHHPHNRGRGAAFVSGAREACGDIVGFLDVDLEVSPVYLIECVRMITHDEADMVIGQRHYRVEFGLVYRHILSRSYSWLVSTVLGIPREFDSESGYKFFKRSVLEPYLNLFTHQGWFWDTEVVSRFHWGGRRIGCVPCLFLRNAEKSSTVRPVHDTVEYCKRLALYWFSTRALRNHRGTVCERPREDLPQKVA